jgi:hypothetical protein
MTEKSDEVAHYAFMGALLAHMDGDDETARRQLAVCLEAGRPLSWCCTGARIYSGWWAEGELQTDAPSKPAARQAYNMGVEAYKKRDLALADAAWHEVLDLAETGTAVFNDALAMLDLIPKKPPTPEEAQAREALMLGMIAYSTGDVVKARAKWTESLESVDEDDPEAADSRRFLNKLDSDAKKQ